MTIAPRFVAMNIVFIWFFFGGIAHFVFTEAEMRIVPPYIPCDHPCSQPCTAHGPHIWPGRGTTATIGVGRHAEQMLRVATSGGAPAARDSEPFSVQSGWGPKPSVIVVLS